MAALRTVCFALTLCFASGSARAADPLFPDEVSLPAAGSRDLRLLTPQWLEIRGVSRRPDFSHAMEPWGELEGPDLRVREPKAESFGVSVDGHPAQILRIGFRRHPIFADYHAFDLREMNQIFLQLAAPVPEGGEVKVTDTTGKLWPTPLSARLDPDRESPLIHFNRLGYAPGFPKRAYVSRDLGSAGELSLPDGMTARLVDSEGKTVFTGTLIRRPDAGWKWHQEVSVFDFSPVDIPGRYRIKIDGLGSSAPIRIHEGALAAAARLHALGLYHQRSGAAIGPPYTRFAHPASHTAPAEIPDGPAFRKTDKHVGDMARKNTDPAVQTAPRMDGVNASLYPFVRRSTIDVSGGHFDAGDYSKYTLNSAALIHVLTFAVDHCPGVAEIDNLGLPESGDGVPDALQIALWEADFLRKMQDADGGFFFLVYPRDRAYELDVLPEHGDPQVVFPKTTASTAAAVGALAQLAASPVLRQHDPARAAAYLKAALAGHAFLTKAIAQHGLAGSFQTISHYGAFAGHTDELCYAAAGLFAATGDAAYEKELKTWWPDPTGPQAVRWGWWPLYEAYGWAARTYAFAEKNGGLPVGTADPVYLAAMQLAICQAGDAVLKLRKDNAFGIPLSLSGKRRAQMGWYWAMDQSFDAVGAWLLTEDPERRARLLDALIDAAGFESGGNPSDRSFVSGSGPVWRRQIVNRLSLNDDRVLAAPGLAVGNVFSSPYNLRPYQIEGASGLRRIFYPGLDDFAFYDRAETDAYNLRAECVSAISARILAGYLFLMAQTPAARQPWVPKELQIQGVPAVAPAGEEFTAGLRLPDGLTLADATVIWEQPGHPPTTGANFRGVFPQADGRLEVEVVWPDGRRLSAVHPLRVGRKFTEPEPARE